MKKILLILSILFSFSAISQPLVMGEVYNLQFAGSAPAGTTTALTGSTTVTNKPSSVQYAGGSGSASNYSENIRVNTETYGQTSILTAFVKPTVSGLGFTLAFFTSTSGIGTGSYCRFNTTTNVLTLGAGGTDQVSTSALSYTLGSSTLEIKLYYSAQTTLTTASIRVAGNLDANTIVSTSAALSPSAPGLYGGLAFHSGTCEVFNIAYKQLTTKYATLLGYGDSNMFGLTITYPNAYFNLLKAQSPQQITSTSFSGARTQDFINQATQNANLLPDVLMIGLGTNDGNLGTSMATYIANIQTLINAQTTRTNPGVVFLLSILPNNQAWSASVPTWNTALAALANGTNVFYIDINTTVNNGSGNLNAGDTTDGVHLSIAGHLKVLAVLNANTTLKQYVKF